MKLHKFITILAAILLPLSLWGQGGKVTVKGTVSDASGPLPGATVYQDGNMQNGTMPGLTENTPFPSPPMPRSSSPVSDMPTSRKKSEAGARLTSS